jgi:hypothetical protein
LLGGDFNSQHLSLEGEFELLFKQGEKARDLLRFSIGVHYGFLDHFIKLRRGQASVGWLAFGCHWLLVVVTMPEFPLKSNVGCDWWRTPRTALSQFFDPAQHGRAV